MSDIRTLHWYESAADNQSIAANGWRFQVAKSVATANAAPTFNIVWQSQGIAPATDISWKVEYALNWTAQVPASGVKVTVGGAWQQCNKGDSYDLNEHGYWVPSATPAGPDGAGWLNVGAINYSYPGVLGIHIVVGVKNNETGRFEPIFLDLSTLPEGSSAKYQPLETVSWWLEANDLTGQVFHSTKSRSTTYDFTNPSNPVTGDFEWSTSFTMLGGKWVIAPGPVPQALRGPPRSAKLPFLSIGGEDPLLLELDLGSWLVSFAVPLSVAALGAAATALYNKLKSQFKELKVVVVGTDGTKLKLTYKPGSAPGTLEQLGFPLGAPGPAGTIDGALKDLQKTNVIPQKETWTISAGTASLGSSNGSLPSSQPESKINGNSNGHGYGPGAIDQNSNTFVASHQPKSPFLQQGYSQNTVQAQHA
ncbi:hypothetical protein QBC40DRAFT_296174 [Triangularia verruculosa]|uniref:Uncharacterized protein n=1 Tax=Triangularia verruculosa TaxID=2587418 RepID=A0AAN6XIL7_9PEZI|nr:hypothetical protein QBC40DRAFT_296174 [Triangularia verruculosa]